MNSMPEPKSSSDEEMEEDIFSMIVSNTQD